MVFCRTFFWHPPLCRDKLKFWMFSIVSPLSSTWVHGFSPLPGWEAASPHHPANNFSKTTLTSLIWHCLDLKELIICQFVNSVIVLVFPPLVYHWHDKWFGQGRSTPVWTTSKNYNSWKDLGTIGDVCPVHTGSPGAPAQEHEWHTPPRFKCPAVQ